MAKSINKSTGFTTRKKSKPMKPRKPRPKKLLAFLALAAAALSLSACSTVRKTFGLTSDSDPAAIVAQVQRGANIACFATTIVAPSQIEVMRYALDYLESASPTELRRVYDVPLPATTPVGQYAAVIWPVLHQVFNSIGWQDWQQLYEPAIGAAVTGCRSAVGRS